MSIVIVARVDQQELGKNAIPLLNVWTYFNLVFNVILLPILVLTFMLSKRVTKRHPSLINVCLTWILSGIFSLLLFFGGRAKPTDPDPSSTLCIAQTSLLYGILPMWSVAVFVLMYFIMGIVSADGRALSVSRVKMMLMLGAPYIAQICFSIATLIISLKRPNHVTREHRFFYCALRYPPLSDAMSIFTFIVCLGIIIIILRLCLLLYRNCRALRRTGELIVIDLQFLVRVIVFAVFIFLGMFVDVVSVFSQRSLAPDLYTALAGTVVFLVFGSQADVLRVWCFWQKDGPVQVSPTPFREAGWVNLDFISSPQMNLRDYSAILPSPTPAHLAHGHGRSFFSQYPQ
ncbi:hypothetical protein J3R30DRAFT_3456379 [Lentinula aciculospora]|uniref:Uncharacterized protein n=1 Tax=Lentinula aciculospora TaxID=153920 RepID=A0A9W9AI14_9AGAR|nr:hypothetical protein J3R30DRAFT_3456379 [Lentinula aciculospora]